LNLTARQRILSRRGEPLFIADWEHALMIHFEVDAGALQRDVPFQLDLWAGRAFVSLVAFTMRGMRPRMGGRLAAWLFRPIATHHFLNVRTYVRHGSETGIHFLAEWLSDRFAVRLGPATFGLPYRYGRMDYQHEWLAGDLRGCVMDSAVSAALAYRGTLDTHTDFQPCVAGSLAEWLMERYTAFNCSGGRRRFFRVWHAPWPQTSIEITMLDDSLLTSSWPWFKHTQFTGANFSPGVRDVWMGRPQKVMGSFGRRS
jgi:hypothetical protein